MTFTVAIDGLAGSGKGTLAIALADKFNLAYFDTGLLYRGLAYIALDEFGEDFTKTNVINIAKSFRVNTLKESKLRSPILGKYASEIGAIPEVRKILIKIQREFKEKSPSNRFCIKNSSPSLQSCSIFFVKNIATTILNLLCIHPSDFNCLIAESIIGNPVFPFFHALSSDSS